MILDLVEEATDSGAGFEAACELVGLSPRTVQRWKTGTQDGRCGPRQDPPNKLPPAEREKVLETVNTPEFRDLSPRQIVPTLADRGVYLASESTVYRILHEEDQMRHRAASKPPTKRSVKEHVATGPNQVWSWDITYLQGPIRGAFFFLYLVLDVWSRRIVGAEVHEIECSSLAAALVMRVCLALGIDPQKLVLHSDNGGPMKGSTLRATLELLGIIPSFSRPHTSDDNPYSEALFRTLKYRPEYPTRPFQSIEEARAWVEAFVLWYNTEHLHSAIRFVTPDDRHFGREVDVLAKRSDVYDKARQRHPERWSRSTRNWTAIEKVYLNPEQPDLPTGSPRARRELILTS